MPEFVAPSEELEEKIEDARTLAWQRMTYWTIIGDRLSTRHQWVQYLIIILSAFVGAQAIAQSVAEFYWTWLILLTSIVQALAVAYGFSIKIKKVSELTNRIDQIFHKYETLSEQIQLKVPLDYLQEYLKIKEKNDSIEKDIEIPKDMKLWEKIRSQEPPFMPEPGPCPAEEQRGDREEEERI